MYVLFKSLRHITRIFNACITVGYCPQHLRHVITAVLRKMGRNDYTQPKSCRPIVLLYTLGDAMEKMIATQIIYIAEFGLLSAIQTGGRKMTSPNNTVHLLVEAICATWGS